jgi:hypothetical protein
MNRVVLNVATGHYVKGQNRLRDRFKGVDVLTWSDQMPSGCPNHRSVPYAFKAYAIQEAIIRGYSTILWADACIVPHGDLEPLWNLIETQGYWFSRNGFKNGEWCSDAALPLLEMTREESFGHEHVVATTFGLDVRNETGRHFAAEYFRYAKNGAFKGPWKNDKCEASSDARVRGHRHDQTAASVLCHRLGMALTDPPAWFSYRGGEIPATKLIADGAY